MNKFNIFLMVIGSVNIALILLYLHNNPRQVKLPANRTYSWYMNGEPMIKDNGVDCVIMPSTAFNHFYLAIKEEVNE